MSAQIRQPRIVYATCVLLLVLFGLLMIYSSSSIVGLTSAAYNNDAAYFLVRQAAFAAAGVLLALVVSRLDYHIWQRPALVVIGTLAVVALALVFTPLAGHDAYGATRWLGLGPFTLQPSEFAKFEVVLVAARVFASYFDEGSITGRQAVGYLIAGVALPLVLIAFQPDKGTCGILVLTLMVMLYLSGYSGVKIVGVSVLVVVVALCVAWLDDYSRARILTMLDPFRDEYGAGYQLIQGYYAFGSGGLLGRGLGMSRQKYNYLPMAHNDFIFAVVGEEFGFVGATLMIAAFAVLMWAGLKIAQNATDLTGRLVAAGSTSLVIIQLLLNLMGVVGVFPLSGKPVPFVSYGGSSVISSLLLAGLTMSVSFHSTLPETVHDLRRRSLRVAEGRQRTRERSVSAHDDPDSPDDLGVSATRPRSARLVGGDRMGTRRPRLEVIEGGAQVHEDARGVRTSALGQVRQATRDHAGAPYVRTDLGEDATERLLRARSTVRERNDG